MADPAPGTKFEDLPEAVLRHIDSFAPNDVALSLRRVNKKLHKVLKVYTRVQVSKPLPPHAFVGPEWRSWGPNPQRRVQREQLLVRAARLGTLSNVKILVQLGFPTTVNVVKAATASGDVDTCVWLVATGGPGSATDVCVAAATCGNLDCCRRALSDPGGSRNQLELAALTAATVAAAAKHNRRHILDWLLQRASGRGDRSRAASEAFVAAASGGHLDLCLDLLGELTQEGKAEAFCQAVSAAADGGHGAVVNWFLQLRELLSCDKGHDLELLRSVARGCSLEVLRRVCSYTDDKWGPGVPEQLTGDLMAAAVASPTDDWRAKFEWLQQQAGPLASRKIHVSSSVAKPVFPGAVERLKYLAAAGFTYNWNALCKFANTHQNFDLLLCLEEIWRDDFDGTYDDHYHTISFLLGFPDRLDYAKKLMGTDLVNVATVRGAVVSGNVQLLKWLEGPEAGEHGRALLGRVKAQEGRAGQRLVDFAAGSGQLESLKWLIARGYELHASTFAGAAEHGALAVLEFLVAKGCSMREDGRAYGLAAKHSDVSTLRLLRGLGCPCDSGALINDILSASDVMPNVRAVLEWAREEGLPVRWTSAKAWANRIGCKAVVEWIEEEERRQEEGERPRQHETAAFDGQTAREGAWKRIENGRLTRC